MTEHMPPQIAALISQYGDLGLTAAMFLESSIIPIPSEVVVAGAAAVGIPVVDVVLWGSIGSTFGAMLGYALGRYAGLPVIEKVGRYIFIKPEHIAKAQAFAQKHGVWGVLLGRLLPIIPFKVFSIAAGMTKIPFVPFVLCTAVGVVPRLYILAIFGVMVMRYLKVACIAAAVLLAGWILFRWITSRNVTKPDVLR